jgi:ribosomal protein L32
MGVNIIMCDECGEYDGRHRGPERLVTEPCSEWPATVEELQPALKEAREHLTRLLKKLDTFKVKCPTCRCRILPGKTCACCADSACEDVDPMI